MPQLILKELYLFDRTGKINVLINKGSNAVPNYLPPKSIESSPGNNIFPHQFAAVIVFDLDNDGKKDLIIGASARNNNAVWFLKGLQ